jgi:hypothetical protein
MSQTFNGVAVIYGAAGEVTLDGTARGALTSSLGVSMPMDHIVKLTDSEGKRKGYVKPEFRKRVNITFTPSAASVSGSLAASDLPEPLCKLVIAGADLGDANGTYIVDESIESKQSNTGVIEFTIAATQYMDDGTTDQLTQVIT